MNPLFRTSGIQTDDLILIQQALEGSKSALEDLIKKHQTWIFNVALHMVSNTDEAADITQDVLIKIITKLGTFKQESNFRTWMYRIIKNHFLNSQRGNYEISGLTFEEFGKGLDATQDVVVGEDDYEVENKLLVKEAKLSCMKAMLMCLDREQRLIYILGELFQFPDSLGSEVMEISRANFRIKLHRARTQLYEFMNQKCGLLNPKNPCRCARKTVGFIKKGYVDPQKLQFQKDMITTIDQLAEAKVASYQTEVLQDYQTLFLQHPYLDSPDRLESVKKLLSSRTIVETFNLQ